MSHYSSSLRFKQHGLRFGSLAIPAVPKNVGLIEGLAIIDIARRAAKAEKNPPGGSAGHLS
jgi:hypothetical protein